MSDDEVKQKYLKIIDICLDSAKKQQASAGPTMKDYFDGFIRGIEFIREQIEK
jgi:hypothetical protein